MSGEEELELRDSLHSALAGVLRESEGSMLIKFTLQAEVIDADGTTSLWTVSSSGMSTWDKLGMLDYARMHYQHCQYDVDRD